MNPASKKTLCKMIKACQGNIKCVWGWSDTLRKTKNPATGHNNWGQPDLRDTENFSYANGWPGVLTSQFAIEANAALKQLNDATGVSLSPFSNPGTTPFSQDAVNAGLWGNYLQGASKQDLLKWCDDCNK